MGRHKEFDPDEALDAAVSVFWQRGFEGTSFDDLTKATGVARPGLYAAFGNKEAFYRKVLDRYDSKYMGFMKEALDEPDSLKVVERILLGSIEVQMMHESARGCLVLNGALACSQETEPIQQDLIRRQVAAEEALARRLKKAQRDGDLSPGEDCAALAAYVMAVSHGMAIKAKAGATKKTLHGIVERVLVTWPSKNRD